MRRLSTDGWEVAFCPRCGYAVEKCYITRLFTICPVCLRRGKTVSLVDRFIIHNPDYKVLRPKVNSPV